MVLRFLVKRYFEFIGHFLPFLWRRMLEEGRQMDSKLKTDEWKTFYIIGVDLNIQFLRFKNSSTWIWPLCLCRQSCWHCDKTHQAAWHLNDTVGKCNIIFSFKIFLKYTVIMGFCTLPTKVWFMSSFRFLKCINNKFYFTKVVLKDISVTAAKWKT